jgi:hypothetical protein
MTKKGTFLVLQNPLLHQYVETTYKFLDASGDERGILASAL